VFRYNLYSCTTLGTKFKCFDKVDMTIYSFLILTLQECIFEYCGAHGSKMIVCFHSTMTKLLLKNSDLSYSLKGLSSREQLLNLDNLYIIQWYVFYVISSFYFYYGAVFSCSMKIIILLLSIKSRKFSYFPVGAVILLILSSTLLTNSVSGKFFRILIILPSLVLHNSNKDSRHDTTRDDALWYQRANTITHFAISFATIQNIQKILKINPKS
jgi:hypothetical protein